MNGVNIVSKDPNWNTNRNSNRNLNPNPNFNPNSNPKRTLTHEKISNKLMKLRQWSEWINCSMVCLSNEGHLYIYFEGTKWTVSELNMKCGKCTQIQLVTKMSWILRWYNNIIQLDMIYSLHFYFLVWILTTSKYTPWHLFRLFYLWIHKIWKELENKTWSKSCELRNV